MWRIISTWAINFYNACIFLLTWGRRVAHEGRFRHGKWVDWYRFFSCRPQSYCTPESEEEICGIVRKAKTVRVVGAGHSFNEAPLTDGVMISLDELKEVTFKDYPDKPGWKVACAQAGIRLRDLSKRLSSEGLSLSVAGSTDAQSLGGLVATDLHGTGRCHGFLSELLLAIRIVDAEGKAKTFHPEDEVFQAACGGAGTCGVVVSMEILCEPAFNLAKANRVVPRVWAEENIDKLLEENTHLSFYYFGGMARRGSQQRDAGLSRVQLHKWNRTIDLPSTCLRTRKVFAELLDFVFGGYLIEVARKLHISNRFARLGLGFYSFFTNTRELVHPSAQGFSRTIYFRHDEIEYGVPFERYKDCLKEVRALLNREKYPSLIEVRFTPDHSQAILGPGAGRRTAYIELAPSTSRKTDPIFQKFEQIVLKYGGQPHLGKKLYLDRQQMVTIYGQERMDRFEAARKAQDPNGKFLNEFTAKLFH